MKKISKSALKPKMLECFRHIEETGEPLLVTNHNKPVLIIEPVHVKKSLEEVFGSLWGDVHLSSDIMKPETEEWGDA